MPYRIRNWQKFQHYQNKKPGARLPWIKLYSELLNDVDWHNLSPESAKFLVMVWMVAADTDGVLPRLEKVAFRVRIPLPKVKALISTLSHFIENDTIEALDNSYLGTRQDKEEEKEKNNDIVGQGPTPEDLIQLWNKTAHGNLPRVKFLTEARKRQAQCRLKENPLQEFWEDVLAKVNRSPLLRGEKGGWKASFDWVLNPTNLTKVVEGNYDEK